SECTRARETVPQAGPTRWARVGRGVRVLARVRCDHRPPVIRALLASDALPALDVVLAGRPARRAVLVPTAAAALSDRDAIVAPVRAALAAAGAEVVEVEAGTPGALAEALREA